MYNLKYIREKSHQYSLPSVSGVLIVGPLKIPESTDTHIPYEMV